jgi:predicted amidohydrolase
MKIKLAAVQYALKDMVSSDEFVGQVTQYVELASEQNPDFILFPEYLTTPLISAAKNSNPFEAIRELDSFTDFYVDLFSGLSKKYNTHIIAGTHIVKKACGEYANRAFLFYPDGTYGYQDKIHLTPVEKKEWKLSAGDELTVFDTELGKLAILICYDVEFPELSRRAMELGASILFCPSSTESKQGMYRVRRCSQARAIENQIYVVETGTIGALENVTYMDQNVAWAGIFAPCDADFPVGGVIAEGIESHDMIIFGEIDLQSLENVRQTGSVPLIRDRRHDLYEVAFK